MHGAVLGWRRMLHRPVFFEQGFRVLTPRHAADDTPRSRLRSGWRQPRSRPGRREPPGWRPGWWGGGG